MRSSSRRFGHWALCALALSGFAAFPLHAAPLLNVDFNAHLTVQPGQSGLPVMNGLQLLQTSDHVAVDRPVSVSTYAGTGAEGSRDGFLIEATLRSAGPLTLGPDGRIYFAQANIPSWDEAGPGQSIRVIDTSGAVTTFAGSDEPGLVDGPRLKARFRGPNALVFDHGSNMFVTDRLNHRIRKIDRAGNVSTFAGSTAGYRDGVGTDAQFYWPIGMCIDQADNLYVADFQNIVVRKITPQAVVTTYAGAPGVRGSTDGFRTAARFDSPDWVAISVTGDLFVADWLNGLVRKIDQAGMVSTFASGLGYIEVVATDGQGGVYASVPPGGGAHQFIKFDSVGKIQWAMNNTPGFQDGPISLAQFQRYSQPIFPSDGNILMADGTRIRLIQIQPGGECANCSDDGIPNAWRLKYFGPGFAQDPNAAATADPDHDGANNYQEYLSGTSPVDSVSVPNIPVSVSTYAGSVAGGKDGYRTEATLQDPSSLTFDLVGRLWITEATFTGFATTAPGAHRIRIMGPDEVIHTYAGSTEPGLVDGPQASARFNGPNKLAFDHHFNVFVADRANHRVRKIDLNGNVSTFAGSQAGFKDGVGTDAMFNTPIWIAIDASDNLFVADFENLRIRKVTPQGVVSTYAGGVRGFADGPLASAMFDSPNVIAFGPDGALFVSDWSNGAIRKIKDGIVTTFATGLTYCDGVTADNAGNVYATANGAHFLAKYAPNGTQLWTIPTGQGFQDGPIAIAQFSAAVGPPVPAPDGTLLVRDVFNQRIRQVHLGVPPLLSITPPGGLFTNSVTVAMTSASDQASIHYSLQGEQPTANSAAYKGPFSLDQTTAVKARLFVNGNAVSDVVSATFTRTSAQPGGLLAMWTFDEASGNVAHDSAGHFDGTLFGGASFVPGGVSGTALRLDRAAGGYVNMGNVLGLTDTSFSIAAWIKMTPGDRRDRCLVVAKHEAYADNGYFLNVNPANSILGAPDKAMFYAGDAYNVPVSRTSVNDGQWHLLVAVHELAGNNSIYVDGIFEAAVPSKPVTTSPASFLIGGASYSGAPEGFFNGLIDQVQMYSRALTEREIGLLFKESAPVPAAFVSTLAGSGNAAFEDGSGTGASFNGPNGGFVDPDQSAYIADTFNHRIRRVDLVSGAVSTVAGTGAAGFAEGTALSAQFNAPLGTFVDKFGTVFVADTGNNRVRKISADNPRNVASYAGSGVRGYRDGFAADAQFDFPNDLVIDSVGNFFISEFNNHTIRKLSNGVVSTFVGHGTPGADDGVGAHAGLNQPAGLAIDQHDNLYVTEWGSHRIRKVTPSGLVTTIAGSILPGFQDGAGPEARFYQPDGIVVDSRGVLFVTEHGNSAVRRILPDGTVSTVAGLGSAGYVDGSAAVAKFNGPGGIGLDAAGNLVIADTGNHRVRMIRFPAVTVPVTVERSLPNYYAPGRNVTVTLTCQPNPALPGLSYAIEDVLPPNWTISKTSDGGSFDAANHKVKFGPFFDLAHRTLTYEAIAPSAQAGPAFFQGLVSADGVTLPVTGVSVVNPAPLHPADISAADYRISANELTSYAAAWRKGQLWSQPPNPIPIDYVSRAGVLWKNGEVYTIDPNVTNPPLWWINDSLTSAAKPRAFAVLAPLPDSSATRVLPPTLLPTETAAVKLLVEPSALATAYALEEFVPAGLSVATIGAGGEFDPTARAIRWGPFLDNVPRALSYTVTLAPGGSGPLLFHGSASFDGKSSLVAGQQFMAVAIRFGDLKRFGNDDLGLSLESVDGRFYRIEASTDLESWTAVAVVQNADGILRFHDPVESRQKFYRVVSSAP